MNGHRDYFAAPPHTPIGARSALFSSPQPSSNTSRKRSRHDYITSEKTTPYSATTGGWTTSFTPGSPAPLANSRYHIAGGLDTPTQCQSMEFGRLDGDGASDLAFRRGREYDSPHISPYPYVPSGLARESNGRPRIQSKLEDNSEGWGTTVFNTVTKVAGTVWDFCTAGAFRGFYAGGGQGYSMQNNSAPVPTYEEPDSSIWLDVDVTAASFKTPGHYPDSDHTYESRPSSSGHRPAKKMKPDRDLQGSWVMVGFHPSRDASRESSPVRRKVPTPISTASPAPIRRPAPGRVSSASLRRTTIGPPRPSPTSATRPASSAGLRSPSRPSLSSSHSRTQSHNDIVTPRGMRYSTASATTVQEPSPIVVKTAKYVEKARRREKEEDKELRRFNKRLKDMIREGQEALGSKIEIEMEDDEDSMW